ncbi:mitochondrial amidoxime-reducing component 1 isoform X2 [Nematostella vectensis]|nr:mitochondrial amidoxime-reducing component 1 isoform X2 [Nematostella vectensis]
MVLISPSFDKEMENLILDAPGMETLKIPLSRRTDKIKDIQVTRTWAKGVSVGDAASDWVSRFLDIPGCELCCVVKPRYLVEDPKWGDRAQPGDKVDFADNTPLMICSQASLKELSKHYKEPVNMGRFRPNIIVDGGTPYDEDSWRTVMIGNTVRLRWIKACSRCSAINVDPVRGVRTLEPLHTLSRVRKIPWADRRHQGKPWFGWNACPDVIGLIKVGDLVWVLSE